MKKALQKRLALRHDTLRIMADLPRARLQDVVGGVFRGVSSQPPVCSSQAQKTGIGSVDSGSAGI